MEQEKIRTTSRMTGRRINKSRGGCGEGIIPMSSRRSQSRQSIRMRSHRWKVNTKYIHYIHIYSTKKGKNFILIFIFVCVHFIWSISRLNLLKFLVCHAILKSHYYLIYYYLNPQPGISSTLSLMATKTLYKVYGYEYCSYANRACSRVKDLAKANAETIEAECTITSRSEYKAWLKSSSSGVPSSHTSSPACFENNKFIGGCDELCEHLDQTYPNSTGSSNSFCALQ